MCKAMEDMCNEVKKETRLENLKNLMKTLSLTIEQVLDEADMYAREHLERMTHEEVFDGLRERVNNRLVQSHV